MSDTRDAALDPPDRRAAHRQSEDAAIAGSGPEPIGSVPGEPLHQHAWQLPDRMDPRRRSQLFLGLQRQRGNSYIQRLMRPPAKVAAEEAQTEPVSGETSSTFVIEPLLMATPPSESGSSTTALQRQEAPAVEDNIAKLDELLGRLFTPEEEVIALLGKMSPAEKHTVLVGYGDKLARTLNVSEMKRAVVNLQAELPVALDWIQKASLLTVLISFYDIQSLIHDAPQAQRDMLKNERWKSFFMTVCNDETIIPAVTELHFDLPTQLTWIKGESSPLFSLNLAKLKPLLTTASRADLDIVGGNFWLPFWTDVCTNATMAELVDILFPTDLVKKLEWMDEEGTDVEAVLKKVHDATQDQRDRLKNERWKKFFLDLCDNSNIVRALSELHFDLPTQLTWIKGEASPLFSLNLDKLKPILPPATPVPRADLDIVGGDAWRSFWVDVCTNDTMNELVDILFPANLGRKLEWMDVEGTTLPKILGKVSAADAASRLTVFGNAYVQRMMIPLLDDTAWISFLLDLGGNWSLWRGWMTAKGAKFKDLATAAVARNLITEPTALAFAKLVIGGPAVRKVFAYLRSMPDATLAILKSDPMAMDLISELYPSDKDALEKALNGETKTANANPAFTETLQTGPTTSPFTPQNFPLSPKFSISYRDVLNVSVGIAVTAASGDARAARLLPNAKTIWSRNILGAWDNKFKLHNADREVPIRFKVSLDAGPNPVLAHSYRWVWPNLNAGNWIVPDNRLPHQKAAVSTAPIHEFGHIIGNQDEYDLSAAHYVAVTGKVATTDPNAVAETDSAGNKRFTNTLSLMGSGSTVLATHFGQILATVNANLLPGEQPFTVVPV